MTRTFYFPAETDMLWLGGATQKADNNMQALRLLNQLELDAREPTLEEQNEAGALYRLGRYPGFTRQVFRSCARWLARKNGTQSAPAR